MTSMVDQTFKDFADVARYRAVSMKAWSKPSPKKDVGLAQLMDGAVQKAIRGDR